MDLSQKKRVFGVLALVAGAGYLYFRHKEKKGAHQLSGVQQNPFGAHRLIDTAMGFVKMNPIAKTIISETLKRAVPEEPEIDVLDADYEVL